MGFITLLNLEILVFLLLFFISACFNWLFSKPTNMQKISSELVLKLGQ